MFHGAIVATVTPFRDGKVDAAGLRRLVEFQIRSGTDGIGPCGTTSVTSEGKAPSLARAASACASNDHASASE